MFTEVNTKLIAVLKLRSSTVAPPLPSVIVSFGVLANQPTLPVPDVLGQGRLIERL